MKRTALSLLVAGVIASGIVMFGAPSDAKADHRRTSVGVFVGSGGFGVGVGYGSPHYVRHRPAVIYSGYGYGGYTRVVPSCCQYERVYHPSYYDAWGWHPGFYETYRVCDHHGRLLVRF
jgi:hypothetical protein